MTLITRSYLYCIYIEDRENDSGLLSLSTAAGHGTGKGASGVGIAYEAENYGSIRFAYVPIP